MKATPEQVSSVLGSRKKVPRRIIRRPSKPVPRRPSPSPVRVIHGSRSARSVAIKIIINALQDAGYDTNDLDVEKLYQDLELE
jgi:hypothetical protein